MKGITTILFDIDGTLLDTSEFIFQATEHAMKTAGHLKPDRQILRKAVEEPFPKYYFTIAGEDANAERLGKIHHEFQQKNFHLVSPFSNSVKTLQALHKKGYKFGAVTSRSNHNSHEILKNAGIYDMFDVIISLEDVREHKPSPEPVLKALELLRELPEHAVMIGDSHLDVEAGKNAGTKTVRVTYGFHADNLHDPEPDFIIHDISDLLDFL